MSDDNKLITERKKKLEELSAVTKLYPNTFRRSTNANELRQKYDGKSKEELESEENIFSVSAEVYSHAWEVDLPAGNYYIKIQNLQNQQVYDFSDGYITVTEDDSTPYYKLVSPDGGEQLSLIHI